MKQNQITNLSRLQTENFENIFNVYQDSNGLYFYNLLNTVVFPANLPLTLFNTYSVKHGDTWPLISYKNYKTPNLWWIILLGNDIHNPVAKIEPGTIIKIPVASVVKEVLAQLGK